MCCREIDINFKKIKKEKSEMENVMTKGFCELSENEMVDLDGGAWYHVVGAVIGGAVGAVGGGMTGAVAGAAVGTITIPGIGTVAGASVGLVGGAITGGGAGAVAGATLADFFAK